MAFFWAGFLRIMHYSLQALICLASCNCILSVMELCAIKMSFSAKLLIMLELLYTYIERVQLRWGEHTQLRATSLCKIAMIAVQDSLFLESFLMLSVQAILPLCCFLGERKSRTPA